MTGRSCMNVKIRVLIIAAITLGFCCVITTNAGTDKPNEIIQKVSSNDTDGDGIPDNFDGIGEPGEYDGQKSHNHEDQVGGCPGG